MSFQIVRGDITACSVDAIVNAANTSLLGGGGVDGAIHRAAGPELLAECRTLNGCKTGEAKITKGYRLPAKYVIHTPGPVWHGGGHSEPELLASCYNNSLHLAERNHCRTVAFPSISTGVYRFPLELAAPIAVETILAFLEQSEAVKEVVMVCFDERTRAAYDLALTQHATLMLRNDIGPVPG
jgi:O-acetyl-ADP-ribose deacetylase (regulator of RNase III)